MLRNLFSQNNSQTDSSLYTIGGYEKKKILIIVAVVGLFVLGIVVLGVFHYKQDRYIRAATAAARKDMPNAKVSDLRVAGGFALSSVRDPTGTGQTKSGSVTIFKINKDGVMTQIASGSSFNPLDLLRLGIPLDTQAKLTKNDLSQVKKNLAGSCDYQGGDDPGYVGFGGSFDPDGWKLDSVILENLKLSLKDTMNSKNSKANSGEKILCVSATHKNSNAATDMKTYISTFSLELQFVTHDGSLTSHKFTFTTGANPNTYTLDGQKISAREDD